MQYTTDPNAIHQYMSSRNRTARWVNSHYASETDFDSPSIPPLELAGMIPSSPSSEASSCDSLPPRMVLRYKDGRPDIPIPKLDQYGQVVRHPSRKCKRGGHESRHACNDEEFSPTHPPEEIRILPFNGSGVAPSHHTRSRSLPRGFDSSETSETTLSSAEPAAQSGYILPPSTSHLSRNAPPSHSNFATWYDNPPSKAPNGPRAPPSHMPSSAISYSPEVPLATPQYAPPPPGGYYYPHNMGPGGVVYSHSTPVASSYHHPSAPATAAGPTYVHPAISHKHRSRFDSEHTPRSKSATGFRAGDHPLLPGRVSYDSGPGAGAASGAYYVLQTTPAGGGQRVHPIPPHSPEVYLHTGPSTSPIAIAIDSTPPPGSTKMKRKKSLLRKLLNFAADKLGPSDSLAKGSSGGGKKHRKLHRRHSIGPPGRSSSPPLFFHS